VDNLKLPSKEECFKLLEKYGTFPNIVEHCKMVNKVAVYLAKKLREKGINVDVDLVDRASLLHDIAKSGTIRANIPPEEENHHIDGEEILVKEGYPEVGHLVRMHSLKEIENLKTWEEKIIQYADVRVRHTRIVSVKERLEDLYKRYNIPPEKRIDEKLIYNLEKEIYDVIGGSPSDLKDEIECGGIKTSARRELSRMKEIMSHIKVKDDTEEAREFFEFARNYYEDGLHFYDKGMFVEAFEAFIISWAYLDIGIKLGMFEVDDNIKEYFTA
jgi:uncharacterized protein